MASRLATRVSRLEDAYRDERAEQKGEADVARLSLMTASERRERMKILAGRIIKDRSIEVAPGESVLDAAVRSMSRLRRAGDQLNDHQLIVQVGDEV
jgi:hypothetical protein